MWYSEIEVSISRSFKKAKGRKEKEKKKKKKKLFMAFRRKAKIELVATTTTTAAQPPIGPTSWTFYQQQRQQAGPVASGLSRLRSAASASNRERSHSTVSNPYVSSHPYRTLRSGNSAL